MNLTSLILIMSIGRKHIYIYFCLEDAIDKTVLLGYLSAPAIFGLAFQWLGMACTSFGMLHKFVKLLDRFFETGRFTPLQLCKVSFSLRRKGYFVHHHKALSQAFISSGWVNVFPCPWAMLSSASSSFWKYSSLLINVGSAFCCCSFASLRRYFAARASMSSLSARILKLRKISAFICDVVIINRFSWFSRQK